MTVEHDKGASPEPGRAAGRAFPHALPVALALGFLVVALLLPGILSEDTDTPESAPDGAEARPVTLAIAPEQTQELSPGALEDLRSAPVDALTIDPEPLLLEPLPEDGGEVTDEAPEVAGTEPENPAEVEEAPAPPEEPFSVGEALARYLLVIRNELNSEFVANCIRYRNRNGAGADCPVDTAIASASSYQEEKALVDELFAVITREVDLALVRSRLERENETLAAVLEDPDSLAALQAGTKLALNNAYLSYLGGNPNPDVADFRTMNDFVNDYNRTIIAGPTQFRCQGGPCVYEYTGPGAEQPR